MTFHFFTKGDENVASSRYRAYLLAKELKKAGHWADVFALDSKWKNENSFFDNLKFFFKYLKLFYSFDKNDVIFLQRTVYNKYFLLAVLCGRLHLKKFIFDIDDAVFEHSFFKTWVLTKVSKIVLCGSHFVLNWAKKYKKNSFYFPNSLPTEIYFSNAKKYEIKNNPLIIGWIGSCPAHNDNLKLLKPIFENLISNGIKFKFRLIGAMGDRIVRDIFNNIKGLNVEIINSLDWTDPQNAAKEINKFDIGLMPLVKNDWNRAKYFKTLEYMACGVTPIVSDFGENTFIVKNGEDGFTANDEKEWVDKIKLLLKNNDLRKMMGGNAKLKIKDNFDVKKTVFTLINLILQKL